jgi:hypothetical protein
MAYNHAGWLGVSLVGGGFSGLLLGSWLVAQYRQKLQVHKQNAEAQGVTCLPPQ